VSEIDIMVENVVDRRSGCELGLGPDTQDGIGQHVGAGVPDGLEIGHWGKEEEAIRLKAEGC